MNRIILAGGGKLGYFLTRMFLSKGFAVTIINSDRAECEQLSHHLKAVVVHGDASDPNVQEEAEVAMADIMLAITPHDHVNLVISQIAALKFGVPRVLALINDPDNEEVFRKLGVAAFSTTKIIANLIEQKAGFEEITNLIPLGEGKITVTEIILSGNSAAAGKEIRKVPLPNHSLVAFILRDGNPIIPRGHTVLQPGDRLLLVALPENYGKILRLFTEGA